MAKLTKKRPVYRKSDFPVFDARQILEPGPTVLISTQWREFPDVMTLGWYTILEFNPSLIGCMIANSNHSFDVIRKSKECVINVPTVELVDEVVAVGNCSGEEVDKFEEFDLTPMKADKVAAPLIKECFANFECKLHDGKLINTYNFFIFEIIKAHVAKSVKAPETLHYAGQGIFRTAGGVINKSGDFTKWKDGPFF